jgi:hypothetical protein
MAGEGVKLLKKCAVTFKGRTRRYLMVPDHRVSGHHKGLHKRQKLSFGSAVMLVFQIATDLLFSLLGVSRNHRWNISLQEAGKTANIYSHYLFSFIFTLLSICYFLPGISFYFVLVFTSESVFFYSSQSFLLLFIVSMDASIEFDTLLHLVEQT